MTAVARVSMVDHEHQVTVDPKYHITELVYIVKLLNSFRVGTDKQKVEVNAALNRFFLKVYVKFALHF